MVSPIETIFDHNITPDELDVIIPHYPDKSRESYIQFKSARIAYEHISQLYYGRGDDARGIEYAAKRDKELWFYDVCD